MPILGWMPNMGVEDAARRELEAGQLTDTGEAIEAGKYNWQDKFGGWLGGYTQEDVEGQAQILRDKGIQKRIDQKYGITGTELTGQGQQPTYKGDVTGISEKDLNNQVSTDQARLAALLKYDATPNSDASKLSPTSSTTQILSATSGLRDTNTKTKEKKVDDRYNDTQRLTLMQLMQSDKRADNQFAVQMAQQNYQNRALEMKDARLERRDRQSAIQQMMAGLATMGASIAI